MTVPIGMIAAPAVGMRGMKMVVCAATCVLVPACTLGADERDPAAGATGTTSPLPEKYACTKSRTATFAPVVPNDVVAELVPTGAPAPVVTNAREIASPWGTVVTVEGTELGDGSGGEYLSFGEGAREIRVAAAAASWSKTRIDVAVPLGAEGKIFVHTRGGAADAGTFVPPWRSSAVLTFAKEEVYGQRLASLDTPDATYVVRASTPVPNAQGDPNARRLTIHRFTADGVAAAILDGLGVVTRASLARGPNGEVDLALVTASGGLHLVHVGADRIELDDGCVPADQNGPLAFARGAGGRVAWVTISKGLVDARANQRALVRLVDADGTGTWRVDRTVLTEDEVEGEGVELADGSVGFAWGEGAGGFLDAKAAPKVAVLPAGNDTIESTALAGAMDDYIVTRTFATSAGLVMTYCNTDDTGFLDDTGRGGVRCRVLARTGPRQWTPFDGYPDSFENLGHDFGFVAGHVASVHRVRGTAERVYRATADATPAVIDLGTGDVSFVRTDAPAAVLVVTSGARVAVVRPR